MTDFAKIFVNPSADTCFCGAVQAPQQWQPLRLANLNPQAGQTLWAAAATGALTRPRMSTA